MEAHRRDIGICGTFDVQNYGDLLFPLIAESELRERLGDVAVRIFSYNTRTPPYWPYAVTSLTELPLFAPYLDGLLIGGGFIIRFDKSVAPEYIPPDPNIHHPTGYWLTPALIALQHNIPVIWNAPGMHCNEIPPWANPLMEVALSLSSYIAVRDEPSRSALQCLTSTPITVVPDTAFGLSRLLNLEGEPSAEFTRLCGTSGLDRPYVLIQATLGLDGFVQFLKNNSECLRNFRFLALPISPTMGERPEFIDCDLPGLVRLDTWPEPLLIAELIGRSEGVVGHSYHLCITALVSGVPVFTRQNLTNGKYCVLQDFENIFLLPPDGELNVNWFFARLGRNAPTASVLASRKLLSDHWDRIAATFRAERPRTASSMGRCWQSLPGSLEDAAAREQTVAAALAKEQVESHKHLERAMAASSSEAMTQRRLDEALANLAASCLESAERQKGLDGLEKQLAAVHAEMGARNARIAELTESYSWRLTAPLRALGRQRRRNGASS
jgi:lipopolysaccharide transport system ATP-binding protein